MPSGDKIRADSIKMKGTAENRKAFSKESNHPSSKSGPSLALKSGGNFQVDTSNATITAREVSIQPLLKSAADYLSPPENPQPRRPLEPILKLSQNILVQQSSRIEQLHLPKSITKDMKSEIASLNASMSDLEDRISALEEFASEIPCDKHQVFDLFRWSRTVDHRFNAIERANDDTNCELADLKEEGLNIHLQLRSLRGGGKPTRLEKAGVIDDALADMKREIKEELRQEFREELMEELKRDFKPSRKSSRTTPAKPFRKIVKSTPPALASVQPIIPQKRLQIEDQSSHAPPSDAEIISNADDPSSPRSKTKRQRTDGVRVTARTPSGTMDLQDLPEATRDSVQAAVDEGTNLANNVGRCVGCVCVRGGRRRCTWARGKADGTRACKRCTNHKRPCLYIKGAEQLEVLPLVEARRGSSKPDQDKYWCDIGRLLVWTPSEMWEAE